MSRLTANVLLLGVAAIWGFGNVPEKTALEHLDPFSTVGIRCLIGFLLIAPFLIQRFRIRSMANCLSLIWVGSLFSIAMVLQQAALVDATVTNVSFLTGAETVLTPIAAWFLLGERPNQAIGIALAGVLVGVALIAGPPAEANRGDLLALVSAFAFALWVVELARHVRTHGEPALAAASQFLIAAIILTPFGAMGGTMTANAIVAAAPELLWLGVLSTALGFGVQAIALRHTTASNAAIITSAESVFGALGGALFLSERISLLGFVGAMIVLAATISLIVSARSPAPDVVRQA